ncbi:hypothetical protein GCM10007884_07020 [Methylobacterium brachythecii]|uniref:Uncharacterized protein n=1 Tax=Methylobacterium brachythecii TaxID=1176177 RepID=A0ABQ6CXA3_9HYPH|nr:hypothetical protein GCM10007884_07020 [Methylobacterium brachythecii]
MPESVRRARTEDVRYLELAEAVSSPIIMSHRIGDASPEIAAFKRIIARKCADWGAAVPEALRAVESGE